MMAQLMEATKKESTHSALPTATATAVSSSSAATVTGSATPLTVLPPAAPLTRTISREREAGSAPSPVLPATAAGGAVATATGSSGSTSHFSAGHSSTTTTATTAQASSTSSSVPPIGASSLSTDEKDVHFNKLSHYLAEMKRELDLAQKQRKDKALESQRLREKCQQLEERLRSEQRKISRLEEQAATYTTTTDTLHMQIASLNETVSKQNMELNKYRTGMASGSAELAPTGTYLPQPRSNGSLHSAQSALSEGSTVLPLAPSTSGTQLSLRDSSSEALTGRSASAGGPATLLCQSRSGGNLEEYFLDTPPVSPPQGYHKHLSRGSAVGSMKSVSTTVSSAGAGGSDRPPVSATGATTVSDPEGTGQSQYRKKSIGSTGGTQSQADLQMKQMLENAVNNINPAAARSKPSPTMTAAGTGSGGGSSGAVSTSTGLHPSAGFSSGNGTPTYRPVASTGFKPLSGMGNPHGMAYPAAAASSQQQQMSGMAHAQPMQQQQHQQQYAGYPQQSPQQQQQQHIYPKPMHQQQDSRGGGYGGHSSPASYLGSNTFPLQQQHQQQHLSTAHHSSSHMQQKQQHSGGGLSSDRDSFGSVGVSSSDASHFNSMSAGSSNSHNNSSSTIGSSCMGKVRDELDGIAARSSVHSLTDLQSNRGGDIATGGSSKGVMDSGL